MGLRRPGARLADLGAQLAGRSPLPLRSIPICKMLRINYWVGAIKMNLRFKRLRRRKKWCLAVVLGLLVMGLSGCNTFSFYRQAIKGQYQLIAHDKKTQKVLADPQTPERLKEKLRLLEKMRAFADQDLKLPVD